jgi:hypothetical protein
MLVAPLDDRCEIACDPGFVGRVARQDPHLDHVVRG